MSPLKEQSSDRRVCIFSQRAIRQDVSRCSGFEFEDVISGIENSALVVPRMRSDLPLGFRVRRWASKHSDLFRFVPSGARHGPLGEDFDLFGCFLQKPVELLALDAVPDWRARSRLAVCVLEEVWETSLDELRPLIRSLSQFDLITSAFASSCEALAEMTGRPVIHLPGAADLKRFAPNAPVDRVIDFYSIGRRRSGLHDELRKLITARRGFYLYDSATKPPIAADHSVHRDLLASLVQRSKLFFVDQAKNRHSDQSKGQISWGPRYVEGMAGGAVQVGFAPDSEDYDRFFNWPEAVYRLPEDPAKAAGEIAMLLDDENELKRRSDISLGHALRKHDWVHRWALILDHFGLPRTGAMERRRQDLDEMAARYQPAGTVQEQSGDGPADAKGQPRG